MDTITVGDSVTINGHAYLGRGIAEGPITIDRLGPWRIDLKSGRQTLALPSEMIKVRRRKAREWGKR